MITNKSNRYVYFKSDPVSGPLSSMPIWWMWVNAGFLRISDALVLGEVASPCIAAWGFACCGSPTRGYSDAFVCGGGGIPMHCCMGFRMLRVSDPRRSDALVLRAMVSDPRHSDALVCGGDGFPHALLHGVSHVAGLRPASTPMCLFLRAVVSDPRLLRCAVVARL